MTVRTISEVESTLREMKAAPKMAIAIELALPRMRDYHKILEAKAMATMDPADIELENVWFTLVLMHEHALQDARDFRCTPRSTSRRWRGWNVSGIEPAQ